MFRVGSGVGDAIYADDNGYGRAANIAMDISRASGLFNLMGGGAARVGGFGRGGIAGGGRGGRPGGTGGRGGNPTFCPDPPPRSAGRGAGGRGSRGGGGSGSRGGGGGGGPRVADQNRQRVLSRRQILRRILLFRMGMSLSQARMGVLSIVNLEPPAMRTRFVSCLLLPNTLLVIGGSTFNMGTD